MTMKIKKYIPIIFLTLTLGSCDFLDREPLDFGNENNYFTNVEAMRTFDNKFYGLFPSMGQYGGVYNVDNNSDNQTASFPNNLFYKGDKMTPDLANSQWNFKTIRDLNYFINLMESKIAKGLIQGGTTEQINHYLGEAYFFKAYDYFRLLSTLGDVPILNENLSDDYAILKEQSKRAPRNVVARQILKWLDKADSLMLETAPETGRLSRNAALIMKARVALFEGTWEKYHAGTAFVPGNSKWIGASTYPDFAFEGGSIESEYNFFFDEAIKAADQVAQNCPLNPSYIKMFNDTKGVDANSKEVILARFYLSSSGHCASHILSRTGAGTGFTRSMVESFLTSNGLPIYADPTYKGDVVMYDMLQNRDHRLTSSVKVGGFLVNPAEPTDTLVNYKPQIWVAGGQGSPTGYELKKWISYDEGEDRTVTSGTSATPVFRSAEAYLIYLEAYYERNGTLGGNCSEYWKALRNRAGVDDDFQKTINATILNQENDLATKSKAQYVDATLYNIRRERRSELAAEGYRLLDLKRWRSLDHMSNYQVEGFNLWDDMYTKYQSTQIQVGIVSQSTVSKYIRPFQVVATNIVYNGYNFPKQHYLEAIPVSEIIMTGGETSSIYQNPGWPSKTVGPADYNFDCD